MKFNIIFVKKPSEARFFGIIVDSNPDSIVCEQLSCSLQFVDASLVLYIVIFGFYIIPYPKMQALFLPLEDMLSRLKLPFFKLQGYCCDGASNVSDQLNGVRRFVF